MNEFINCSLCNYKSTCLQLLSSWRDKVETHKIPVILTNLVKAIFVLTLGTSSLFLSDNFGCCFLPAALFSSLFWPGWLEHCYKSITIGVRFWVLDHVFRCPSRPIFHLLTLLSLITWNTPLVFVLKGYLFNFIRLGEFSLPLNSVLSSLHSPCLIKSRNGGESALRGETKQRLQRWLCLE